MSIILGILGHIFIGSDIFQDRFFIFLWVKSFLTYFSISSMNSIGSDLFMRILLGEFRFLNILSFVGTMGGGSMS